MNVENLNDALLATLLAIQGKSNITKDEFLQIKENYSSLMKQIQNHQQENPPVEFGMSAVGVGVQCRRY